MTKLEKRSTPNLKVSKDFSSVRLIATLTPDTFLRKMIVISTLFDRNRNIGQTAIKQVEELNSLHIDYNSEPWVVLKKHTDFDKAVQFHNKTIISKRWNDTESCN